MRTHSLLGLVVLAMVSSACTDAGATDDASPSQDSPSADPDHDPGVPVLPSATVKQVVAGHLHACALTTAGAVRCWGYTEYGQLGNGMVNRDPHPGVPIPVPVQGLDSGVVQISTFFRTTCALTSAGGVKCWGSDENGELGADIVYNDNRRHISAVPVDVKGLTSGVKQISVGNTSACAVLTSGAIKCWGQDEYGKLGNDSTREEGDGGPTFQPPVDVVGLTEPAKEVSVGHTHACAVMESGALKCWGWNRGQLGFANEGGTSSYHTPQDVPLLGKDVEHVNAGWEVSCVIMKDKTAKCMGLDDKGQLGDGEIGIMREVYEPVTVKGLSGVTQISNNGAYTCAIANGGVYCWGTGETGSLDPSYHSYVAVQVQDLSSGYKWISSGGQFNCIVDGSDAAKCWGDDGGGMLGDGKGGFTGIERSDVPVGVVSLP